MITQIAHVKFDEETTITPQIQNKEPVLEISNLLMDNKRNTFYQRGPIEPHKLNGWILFNDFQSKNQIKDKIEMRKIKDLIDANMDVFLFYQNIVIDYNTQKVSDPDFNFANYKSNYPAELTATNIVTLLQRTISNKQATFSNTQDSLIQLVPSYDIVFPDSDENLQILNIDPYEFSYKAEIYFTLSLDKPYDKFDEIIALNVKFDDGINQDTFSFSSAQDWLDYKTTMQDKWREYSVRMRTNYLNELNRVKLKIEELING